jgi:hypothetical protein
MDIMKDLETLCEIVSEKLSEKIRKVKNNGMSDGDLDTLDKLTHTLASTKKSMAFTEDEQGYSGHYPMGDGSFRESYRGSYRGGSYRNRDSMGRYSRNNLADKMRDLMMDAPDDRTRQEIQRMVEKLENA